MSEAQYFTASDGVRLAWRELGPETTAGRPLLLIHGFISDVQTNWIRYGTAAQLANAGYRCIMSDLRAHGASEKPHDPAAYQPDVLAGDQLALIRHLGLTDYDLAGYSLGARTAVRMLVKGARPGRAILSGMGYEGITNAGARGAHFRNIFRNLGKHERGSPEWMAEAFLKTTGGDAVALNLLIDSFIDTPEDVLTTLKLPVAVICGVDDTDNGSARRLAETLPHAVYREVPGNHMSAVTKPGLADAMLAFLGRADGQDVR